ncbi:Mediator of RNA polymerase II transcription subunit 16, partial [Cryomyces antarcticus]
MDDDQEIEALFADDGSVSLAFTPVPKSIVERFDELHISGCRQKITWSKTGCVAYITSSGHNVGLRPLVKTLSDGQLVLGEEFLLLSTSELETFQSRLVHLEWNTVGSDLAVVDEDGRIDIHNARFTLGNMISVRKGLQDPDDAKGTVVGFHWLPASPNQPKCAYLSDALRKEDNWMIGITGLDRPGLFNPVEGNPAL